MICSLPGKFEYKEAPKPGLVADKAIVKIKRVGICGTDIHAFEGTQPFFNYPRILGHELAGELIEIDNAPGFRTGELVTIIPYFSDQTCIACRMGKPNCCANLSVFGVHEDGGMREYIELPSKYLIHGQGLTLDELALVEPLAIGAHGIKRAQVRAGEFVLVVGAGPIGLAAMEFAKIAGGNVIALDINKSRLLFCKDKLRIKYTIDGSEANITNKLMKITGGDMPTTIIDATGRLAAINNGIKLLAHGGRYVLVGLQKEAFSFSHPEFHKREATLMSSRNATREDFDFVISSIKAKIIHPEKYITQRVEFADLKSEFVNLLNPANGAIKAMVSFDEPE